jgi:hypothetical protein
LTIKLIAALTLLILAATAATPFVLYQQQQSIAQEQQQHSLSDRPVFDRERPVEDLFFGIDNITFSHQTASVNGIQLHYVIVICCR